MGNSPSVENREEIKIEVLGLYPGLEPQLEMAFECHDIERVGILSMDTIEPLLRHLLMQYGLIEYVARFSPNGTLDMAAAAKYYHSFNPWNKGPRQWLSVSEFKDLAIVWLKLIIDTYRVDAAEYQETQLMERQRVANDYHDALEKFHASYQSQAAAMQLAKQAQQAQFSQWATVLDKTTQAQKLIYHDEEQMRQQVQQSTQDAQLEAENEHQRELAHSMHSLLDTAALTPIPNPHDPQGTNTVTYAYSAAQCPYGACASAGAVEPMRRQLPPRPRRRSWLSACLS